jgi:hypothetical protein
MEIVIKYNYEAAAFVAKVILGCIGGIAASFGIICLLL